MNAFDEAFDDDDLSRANEIAIVLYDWNGGRACVQVSIHCHQCPVDLSYLFSRQRYLAKVDLFFDVDVVAGLPRGITGREYDVCIASMLYCDTH